MAKLKKPKPVPKVLKPRKPIAKSRTLIELEAKLEARRKLNEKNKKKKKE